MTNKPRNIFLNLILASLPFGAATQNIHIMPGGHLVENGHIYMMLNNISFVNDGGFTGGNGGVVEFIGASPVVPGIGGANLSPFYNLLIARSAGDVLLNQDISVSGGLAMNLGNLQLNNHNIFLSGNGMITKESEQGRLIGTSGGMITATATLTANVASNPGNLGAELLIPGPAGTNAGTYTISRREVAELLPDGVTGINRSYMVQSATNIPVNGQLRLFYLNAELNGLDANQLNLWTSNAVGSVFTELGRDSNNVTAKWVVKNGINQIGLFTLGPNLQGASIRQASSRTRASGNNMVSSATPIGDLATGLINVYPNPVHDRFTASFFIREAKEVLFSLYDQSGRVMQQKSIYCAAGTNNLSWDIAGYAAGVYYLSFYTQEAKNIKIIKD